MANQDVINRGIQAEELLKNEAFKFFVSELKKDVFETWSQDTKSTDVEHREALYFQHKAICRLEAKLAAWIESAKVEKFNAAIAESKRVKQVEALQEEVPE